MSEGDVEGMSDEDFIPLPPGEGDLDPEQFLPMMAVRRDARLPESEDLDNVIAALKGKGKGKGKGKDSKGKGTGEDRECYNCVARGHLS